MEVPYYEGSQNVIERNLMGEQRYVKVLVPQSCLTLCESVDCSLPGSSVHVILQARILEWVAIPFSRGSSRPRDWTWVSSTAGRFYTLWASLMGGVILWIRKPEKDWERFNRRAEERKCWLRCSGKSLSEEVTVMGSSNQERWCFQKVSGVRGAFQLEGTPEVGTRKREEPVRWGQYECTGHRVWGLVATEKGCIVLSVVWLPDSSGRASALFVFMYPRPLLPPKTGHITSHNAMDLGTIILAECDGNFW